MLMLHQAIIIGGGPAGIATALRLHQQTNIQCTVYELRPEPTTLGGAVGIPPNGMRLLDRLGVHNKIISRGSSSSLLTIHSMKGHVLVEGDMVGAAKKEIGYGYVRIKRTDLLDVLLDEAENAKIPVRYNKQLTTIDDGDAGVEIRFSDGTTDLADILIGCDGIHSAVRRLYVDPLQAPEYTGMSGLGSIISASVLSDSVASQIRGMNLTLAEEGGFGATPCTAAGDQILWGFSKQVELPKSGDTRDGWEVHRKEEVETFKSTLLGLLATARGDWGNAMRQIVNKTSAVMFYPIYKLPFEGTWFKGHVILLGDAAHAMPPHAGQGVSMALEDVFLLSRLLKNPTTPLDDAFRTFEYIRRPRVDEIAKRAGQNGAIRHRTGPWGLWIKEVAISVYMNGIWTLGLDRWGPQHKHTVYDIDEERVE
ncbi:hypothetical protein S40293_10046 [Stachybotrys chartarum IBT 40293]|nr:hypothetical protein S40293_10046 [Stachybotrys chartarum IBT 40293]